MNKSNKVLLQCGYMIWDPYIGFCSQPMDKEAAKQILKSLNSKEETSLNKGAKVVLVDLCANLNED